MEVLFGKGQDSIKGEQKKEKGSMVGKGWSPTQPLHSQLGIKKELGWELRVGTSLGEIRGHQCAGHRWEENIFSVYGRQMYFSSCPLRVIKDLNCFLGFFCWPMLLGIWFCTWTWRIVWYTYLGITYARFHSAYKWAWVIFRMLSLTFMALWFKRPILALSSTWLPPGRWKSSKPLHFSIIKKSQERSAYRKEVLGSSSEFS